jgi:phage protein U
MQQTLNTINQIAKCGSHLYSLKCDTGSVTDAVGLFDLMRLGTSRLDTLGTGRPVRVEFLISLTLGRVVLTVSRVGVGNTDVGSLGALNPRSMILGFTT